MEVLYKSENVAAGNLEFAFYYNSDIASLDNFEILNIGELSKGYDNENNLEVASYPDNIDLEIDALSDINYKSFRTLYENYNITYPINIENVFYIEIRLNNILEFKGGIFKISDDKNSYKMKMSFVDGINMLKNFTVSTKTVLDRLYAKGVIQRSHYESGSYSFGFTVLRESDTQPGYWIVSGIDGGDYNVDFKKVILELFRFLNDNISIDFQNEFLFRDFYTDAEYVTIDRLTLRRVLSNLFGRYVILKKTAGQPRPQISSRSASYAKPENFKIASEDDDYVVYYHDWSGTFGSNVYYKGIDEKSIADILKVISLNLFSYFGFNPNNTVFFRHKRFKNNTVRTLTGDEIITLNKELSIDRVQGVKISDYFTNTLGLKGKDYQINNIPQINYKIPFNAFPTANGYEYRLTYFSDGAVRQVVKFKDLQTGYEDYPQDVIANAEWQAFRVFRDKYYIVVNGVDYDFDSSYKIDYENYKVTVRIISMKRNVLTNQTTLKAIELENNA